MSEKSVKGQVMVRSSDNGSGNGLSPIEHQAITWTNTDLSTM